MAITVAATANGSYSASRSPALTFSSYTPATNDVIIFVIGDAVTSTGAIPTGWVNCHPSGGATFASSTAQTCSMIYHLVTSGEASAVTTTYTATNWRSTTGTGSVCGIVLRGVDTTTPLDSSAAGFDSAAATPHVLPALTGANLSTNSLVVRGISADSALTWTTPVGHTQRAYSGTNVASAIYTVDTLTTAGVNVAATNITPSIGDQYATITAAFTDGGGGGIVTPTTLFFQMFPG